MSGGITNCYFGGAGTSCIANGVRRAIGFDFIVSSFPNSHRKALCHPHFLHALSRKMENLKSRFGRMLSRSRLTGLFENQIRRNEMAIYTRLGAPVDIIDAEIRQRWSVHRGNRIDVYDSKPTERQLKGAKEVYEFDIWWIKAKQTGTYPDGSGVHHIGKLLDAPEDKTGRGFLDETFFRADDGIREIHAECETKRNDAALRYLDKLAERPIELTKA